MSSQDLTGTDSAAESATTEGAATGESATGEDTTDEAASTVDTPCPIVDSIEQIGSQWRLVVLYELQNGERRFNELKRETDANARTLSRVLDDLQESGFVDRRMEEDAPVATYYSLTDKGESLAPVFTEIGEWAQEWLAECNA
ncbi:winged helix-turn-helix transcriptional regulator [Halorubrum halodurans]|uniref:Transcriptional regulator n=1 Tax=Halorubrum halodurans TaxID=1383851 RepID=A0A256IAG7_9EURY|nr:helix-turn-helix domain-containing protein [Halorubrum halodurans]OYR53538.1 transcriptional regulator [Halorubrum halodurans]